METIHTIKTDTLTAKLNKSELDIVQFIESWLPTFDRWSTKELSYKCQLSEEDGNAAADMLILHGLVESLCLMNDTDLFTLEETAIA